MKNEVIMWAAFTGNKKTRIVDFFTNKETAIKAVEEFWEEMQYDTSSYATVSKVKYNKEKKSLKVLQTIRRIKYVRKEDKICTIGQNIRQNK